MTIIDISVPEPHSASQRKIMESMITPGLREMFIACGTKYGKSISGASALIVAAPMQRQSLWRWVAPYYQQAKIGFKYINRMLPPHPYTKVNKSTMTTSLAGIGTQIQFFHGQNPEALEGEGVAGYIIDEAAKQKKEIYSSARTTVTLTQGPLVCMSTPVGKNWFYQKCMEAKEKMEWALKNGRLPEAIFLTAPTSDNPFVPRSSIEFARKNLPDRLFRQYYLAEFIDDSTVFSNVKKCVFGEPLVFDSARQQMWTAPRSPDTGLVDSHVVIGADWGKQTDYSVFVAIDMSRCMIVGFYRFYKVDYKTAVRRLKIFAELFREVGVILHDKTGVGIAIDDMLAGIGKNFIGITFTNALKTDMVTGLIVAFQNELLKIPNWDVLLEELNVFEVRSNSIGMMFYEAQRGKHDDTVAALMLAFHAYTKSKGSSEIMTLDAIQVPEDNLFEFMNSDEAYDDDDY
jgi:hypothetical protein